MELAENVSLLCVGTSHRLVPVRILERVMGEADAIRTAFATDATQNGVAFPFSELAVLATCNRVEFYVVCKSELVKIAEARLSATFASEAGVTPHYVLHDREALRHLCKVTAGLDSMVPGEPQIAGQVARAFNEVVHRNGKALLSSHARHARKISHRARTETGIARRPASISSVAVLMAAEQTGGLAGKRVLVLGAGKIGRVTCEVLRTSGARLTIANRTLEHAEALALKVGAAPAPLSMLPELLADADVVITSTAAPRALIDRELVSRALELRRNASDDTRILIIDIAVPCNVAEEVRQLSEVQVAGIDDLRARVATHLEERRREIPRVEAIIDQELARLDSLRPELFAKR